MACRGSARSVWMKAAVAAAVASSPASSSPASGRRPVNATVAPSPAAALTMPAPTPWVPPLTRTTLSWSRLIWGLPSVSSVRSSCLYLVAEFGELVAAGHLAGELVEGDLTALLVQHGLPQFQDDEVVADQVG